MSEIKPPGAPGAQHGGMPWNESNYPASMRQLAPSVRRKAIEIANALLDNGHPEGQSIRIGIAKAKEWAARHRAIPWREYWAEGAD